MKRGILLLSLFLVSILVISGCSKLCTKEAKVCEDGTVLSRERPNCEFPECPESEVTQEEIESL